MVNLLGLVGTLAFALSALPQAWKCWRDGHARGVSAGLIALWFTGEICSAIYVLGAVSPKALLLVNYCFNALTVGVIAWYKVRPRG